MDWHEWLGIAAGLIWVGSAVPYIFSIVRGTTRPSAISQFLWTILGIINVAAQYSAGASWSILIIVAVTFNTAIFTILSLIGYGYKKSTWIDAACLILAACALGAWYLTANPVLALVFSLIANILAAIPTFIKTYKEPGSELTFAWALVTLAAILGVISNTIWTPANLIMPLYLVVECGTITTLALFGQHFKKRAQ